MSIQKEQETYPFQMKYGKRVASLGFTQISNLFIREAKRFSLKSSELVVIYYLLSYGDPLEAKAFPSLKRLARKLGMSTATVHKAKRGLVAKGLIEIIKPKRKNKYGTNYYDLRPLRLKLDEVAKHILLLKNIEPEEYERLMRDETVEMGHLFFEPHVQ